MEIPSPDRISIDQITRMLREMRRILNEVDPQPRSANREDTCERIRRLCRDGIIPESIGDLMHVVRKSRNRAEYEFQIPEGMEARAIWSNWAAIEDWCARRVRSAA